MEPRRLGQILIAEGLISDEQLDQALKAQRAGGSFLEALIRLEIIEEMPLAHFLGHQFGLETVDLQQTKISPQLKTIIPPEVARQFRVVPVSADKQNLRLAIENPGDVDATELKRNIRVPPSVAVHLMVAPVSQVAAALAEFYPAAPAAGPSRYAGTMASGDIATLDQAGTAGAASMTSRLPQANAEPAETLDPNQLIDQMQSALQIGGQAGEMDAEEFSVEAANEAPVIKMCNYIISEAVKRRVSDIHINPTAKGITLRYRIDGALQIMPSPPPALKRAVIARFKVMARMNITERRKPQDGRIKIRVHEKVIDLRVSVIPQVDGENIVMRILDQASLNLDMTKLGFEQSELEIYNAAIRSPYGLILHTGPTGSGKTTTLYSALSTIYDPKKAFITLEDPVEYEMPGICQVQMDHEVGLDFATALRSALRQDPNIMMVGEIRDKETAKTAISAALTGHLLLSTLHTNDAPSTVTRLIDMGIEPVYVATSVRLIVAQRLMRRVCDSCKQPTSPTDEELKVIEMSRDQVASGTFFKGVGCARCSMTGYKGRVACYEIMRMTPELQELIFASADSMAIRKVAEEQGMRSLRNLAITKWMAGTSTVEEIQRVTMGGD